MKITVLSGERVRPPKASSSGVLSEHAGGGAGSDCTEARSVDRVDRVSRVGWHERR